MLAVSRGPSANAQRYLPAHVRRFPAANDPRTRTHAGRASSLKPAVTLPAGDHVNKTIIEQERCEWIAVNTVSFFNEIALLYGMLSELCTPHTCPGMTAGPKYEYLWADGVKVRKPIKVSAPEYVDLLLSWAGAQLDDEALFPTAKDTLFKPKKFLRAVKTIYKRLFRIYAHIFYHHFDAARDTKTKTPDENLHFFPHRPDR